jgi:hypothetical protein
LKLWEEALGVLGTVQLLENYAEVEVGPLTIAVPKEMGEKITSFIGQRIQILRTDIDYRARASKASKSDASTTLIIAKEVL